MPATNITAKQLEKMMEAQWGNDWRNKTIVSPISTFALRDIFDECGLKDPQEVPSHYNRGLFQILPLNFKNFRVK